MTVTINGNGSITGFTNLDTSDLTVDTNTLYVDSTNNRVGIGTSSPTCRADVSGTIRSTTVGAPSSGAGLELSYGGVADTADILAYDRTGSSFKNIEMRCSNLIFNTGGGGERMRINSSGNVGIGNTSPGAPLSFATTAGSAGDANKIRLYESGGNVYGFGIASSIFTIRAGTGGSLVFYTDNANERMRITSTGLVGIGTSSPTQNLQIYNNSATSGQIQITNASTGATSSDGVVFGYDGSNDVVINNKENTGTKFYTNGSIRMTIQSNGYVLMGTTDASAPTYVAQGFAFLTVSGSYMSIGHASGTSNGQPYAVFAYNGASIGYIGQNTTSTVSYNTSSDYRLKENIQPMTGGLDKVLQLNPVTWTWKSDGASGQGFIAHEAKAVVPDCVMGEKDAVDDDGNPVYQGIDTSFLVATLTKAIQEQQEQIKALETRIQTLENK